MLGAVAPGKAQMLRAAQADFAAALARVGRYGVAKLPAFLHPAARRALLAALEGAPFEAAPERAGEVYQDFDLLVIRPEAPAGESLSPLLALVEEYAGLLREQAEALEWPWLAEFVPTDVYAQRYRRGSRGISPHRDRRRFVKLISIFSLGAPTELRLCHDRRGTPLRRYRLASGDLLLLRAPGFAGDESAGPLHTVAGPEQGVRYSISVRMEVSDASGAGE